MSARRPARARARAGSPARSARDPSSFRPARGERAPAAPEPGRHAVLLVGEDAGELLTRRGRPPASPRPGPWVRRERAAPAPRRRSMSDVDGLAVRALVGAHVLVEVDEERRVRIELALQGAARRSSCRARPAAGGRQGRPGPRTSSLARAAWKARRPRSVRMITLVQPFMEPTLPTEMSAERPRKSAHSSQPLSAAPWKSLTGSSTASSPSRYSTIMRPRMTSIFDTRSRSTPRLSRSSRRVSAS